MKKPSETVVFFGSGPVAARSLELLAQSFSIEAVVTKPLVSHNNDGATVQSVAKGLNQPAIIEASDKKELSHKVITSAFSSRVAVLIDFGIIVAQDVIDTFPMGIVNSHFSILPEWRGPDPITFAILSGQKQTGVSLMLLVEKMDEGPVIAQGIYQIKPSETSSSLTTNLIDLSYALLQNILPEYLAEKVDPQPQETAALLTYGSAKASYSHKLIKNDSLIDWHKPALRIEREVRAYIEWPKSHTVLAGHEVIITKTRVIPENGPVGQIKVHGKRLFIYCGDQTLEILQIKPANKAEMTAEAFLAGYGKYI
jgi:methionyl-tRNA formyltransferase